MSTPLGVHFHNDAGCAVANSILARRGGRLQVQGTMNGYGERCGNADLVPIVANLSLKLDRAPLPEGSLERLTETAHVVAEIANIVPDPHQPYAGRTRSRTKPACTCRRIVRRPDAYEHVPPGTVGNSNHIVVSDLAGRANLVRKAEELGVRLDPDAVADILASLKDLEARGYAFEAADASLELFLRRADRLAPGAVRGRDVPHPRRGRTRRPARSPRRPSRRARTASGTSRRPRGRGRSGRSTTRCGSPSGEPTPSSRRWS